MRDIISMSAKTVITIIVSLLIASVGAYLFFTRETKISPKTRTFPLVARNDTPTSTIVAPTDTVGTTITETFVPAELPDLSREEIIRHPDGTLIYENDGDIFVFETDTAISKRLVSREKIASASGFSVSTTSLPINFTLSRSHKYLFFYLSDNKYATEGENLYVFDLRKKQITNVLNVDFSWIDGESPDEKYLAVFFATGPGGGGTSIFNLENGKPVYSGTAANISPFWKRLLYDKDGAMLDLPFDSYLHTYYVRLVDAPNITPTEILRDTFAYNHQIIRWLNDEELLYFLNVYAQPIPRVPERDYDEQRVNKNQALYDHPITTAWKMNVLTGEKTLWMGATSTLPRRVDAFTPSEYSKKWGTNKIISPNGIWNVGMFGKWPNQKIYLIDSGEEKKLNLGNGNSANWVPMVILE